MFELFRGNVWIFVETWMSRRKILDNQGAREVGYSVAREEFRQDGLSDRSVPCPMLRTVPDGELIS